MVKYNLSLSLNPIYLLAEIRLYFFSKKFLQLVFYICSKNKSKGYGVIKLSLGTSIEVLYHVIVINYIFLNNVYYNKFNLHKISNKFQLKGFTFRVLTKHSQLHKMIYKQIHFPTTTTTTHICIKFFYN